MNEQVPGLPAGSLETRRVDAVVDPVGNLGLLSQYEIDAICNIEDAALQELFRRCALAVLNAGSYVDDARTVLDTYADFDIQVLRVHHGIRLALRNAPARAFVDGEMIRGVREHLFSVLRDILYVRNMVVRHHQFDLHTPAGITDAVFNILRNASAFEGGSEHGTVVCWGGHAVSREEYDYTKEVGYALGLRGFDICTGCGPGAMKGPMKGAAIGHAKQRRADGRYIGITEPGIIAAESPNAIVNELVIMPDMEKRLEAFVRTAHGIIVFPGGVGTTEEILYLLGILLQPANAGEPLPVLLTGPASSADYFRRLLEFIRLTLGEQACAQLTFIENDPVAVAAEMARRVEHVFERRREVNDAYAFNWRLAIGEGLQQPFHVSHESMAAIALNGDQPPHERAVSLRRVFTGIVAGNVKEEGIRAVEQHGPFEIRGERRLMDALSALLEAFVADGRMRLPGRAYHPCYRIVA